MLTKKNESRPAVDEVRSQRSFEGMESMPAEGHPTSPDGGPGVPTDPAPPSGSATPARHDPSETTDPDANPAASATRKFFDREVLDRLKKSPRAIRQRAVLTAVPIRKPPGERFVRVHRGDEYRLQAPILELKDDRECYWIHESLWPLLAEESAFRERLLVTAIDRTGQVFLWPLRVPGDDGRLDAWGESALHAADLARGEWCRVFAKPGGQAYECRVAEGDLGEPAWPDVPFETLLELAFGAKTIDDWMHPVLRRLRGEA